MKCLKNKQNLHDSLIGFSSFHHTKVVKKVECGMKKREAKVMRTLWRSEINKEQARTSTTDGTKSEGI